MKCLVTGGAGFIGSHIARGLIKRGHTVRVFDDLSTGSRSNLAAIGTPFDFVQGDLRIPKDLAGAMVGINVVFHEAALRSVVRSVDNPEASNDVNATGTLNLLTAARNAKVKRVVYASSSSAYGNVKKFPQTESMRCSPISPYAVTKLAAEMYCGVFARTFGLETVALRYFNVFGPRQDPGSQYVPVIPKFMQSAVDNTPVEIHSDGKQSRDFTYIDNVVEANLLAATAPKASGEFFNIACGKSQSLLDIVKVIERLSGKKLTRKHFPVRAGDVRRTWADIRKAKKLLGYKPSVTFEDGLKRTWDWFIQTQTAPPATHQ